MYASCPGYRRARMQPPSFSFCSSIPWQGSGLPAHQKVRFLLRTCECDYFSWVCVILSCNLLHYSLQRLIVIDQDPVATAGLSLPLVGVQAPRPSTDVPAQPRRLHRLLDLRARAPVHGDACPWKAQVFNLKLSKAERSWKNSRVFKNFCRMLGHSWGLNGRCLDVGSFCSWQTPDRTKLLFDPPLSHFELCARNWERTRVFATGPFEASAGQR